MASTSINIQPCKIGSSEQHNQREKPLDYVRSELTHLNESWQSDSKTLSQHFAEVQRAYQQAKGKRMHAKATPIREGVIVVNESTTMQDLHDFARACESRWGLKALQIHLHRDEGHMRSKEWKPNLHAHIVWRWTDEQGVTRKLNRFDMVEMQTLLSETLRMERGVASDKKHLSSLQFKNEAEEKRLNETQEKLLEATNDLGEVKNIREKMETAVNAQIKPIDEIIQDHTTKGWFGGSKTNYESVIGQIKDQEEAKAIVQVSEQIAKERSLQAQITSLQSDLRQERSRHLDTAKKLEQAKEAFEVRNREFMSVAQFLRGYLGQEGFEDFKDEAQAYFREKLGKFLDLVEAVLMWVGGVVKDDLGNRYTADYENARLLINDKTIDEHEAYEMKQKQEEQQRHSRGFRS